MILASVTLWLLLTHSQPFSDLWGMGICAGSLAIGAAGLFTSLLHLSRNTDDRAFGGLCLTANVAAFGPSHWNRDVGAALALAAASCNSISD